MEAEIARPARRTQDVEGGIRDAGLAVENHRAVVDEVLRQIGDDDGRPARRTANERAVLDK